MVSSLVEIDIVRKTKAEVLIQDLLSGPVVGYTYDDIGPMENDRDEIFVGAEVISPQQQTLHGTYAVSSRGE